MFVVIFGRAGCPYCIKAQTLAKKLSEQRIEFSYKYVDIQAQGISKQELSQAVGNTVETVPQIFIDQVPIGGYSDFKEFVKNNLINKKTKL